MIGPAFIKFTLYCWMTALASWTRAEETWDVIMSPPMIVNDCSDGNWRSFFRVVLASDAAGNLRATGNQHDGAVRAQGQTTSNSFTVTSLTMPCGSSGNATITATLTDGFHYHGTFTFIEGTNRSTGDVFVTRRHSDSEWRPLYLSEPGSADATVDVFWSGPLHLACDNGPAHYLQHQSVRPDANGNFTGVWSGRQVRGHINSDELFASFGICGGKPVEIRLSRDRGTWFYQAGDGYFGFIWAVPHCRPANTLRIERVELSSGGALSKEGLLDFAGGNQWGNSQPDIIRGFAISDKPEKVRWSVEEITAGRATFLKRMGPNCELRITALPRQNLYEQRTPIQFRLVPRLLDSHGNEIARDERQIRQSGVGQLRQEYVDHPVRPVGSLRKVPQPSAFINNQLVTGWALSAAVVVSLAAENAGLQTMVNSIFRSPVHHWKVYRDLQQQVNTRSQHMWGCAVDFQVYDYDGDGRDRQDWAQLTGIAVSAGYYVVDERVSNHVHIQQYSPTGAAY